MKKGMKKVISFFLVAILVAQILPLSTMAKSYTDYINEQLALEELLNHPVENTEDSTVAIIGEVEEKRDEYTKVYKKDDGSYTAIMSKEPLHYLEDGVWQEIDSSMILQGGLYTNTSNNFNVELPKDIDSNESLTVENDGHSLSFSVDNIDESSAVVENNIVESDTNIPDADTAIAQTQSAVTYSEVAENTDLQYIVTPNSIKENIIVANKESVQSTYSFTFETNGLDAVKQDDGSVVFKDNSNNIKFRIPRPVMTDNNLAFSYDIAVSLTENADDTVTLIYTPSTEWVNDTNRSYPITIDPAIMVEDLEGIWLEDTYVIYDSTDSSVSTTNNYNEYIGIVGNQTITNNDGTTQQVHGEIYTKFHMDKFKSLGNDVVFTEVQYLLQGASANGKAYVKEIADSNVNFQTVTYNTKPSLSNEIIDYYTSPYTGEADAFVLTHFNMTKAVNDWMNGKLNNGFAIVAADTTFLGLFILNGFYESTNTTTNQTTIKKYNTALVLDFVDLAGYDENLNYHSQEVGRAGTGYVNDFTQSLSVIRNDLSIDGNVMPVTIGMIYNSASYNEAANSDLGNMLVYGNGWAPNYLHAYVKRDDTHFTYYTETGSAIDYVGSVNENGEVIIEEVYSDVYGEHGYEIEYVPASNTQYETIIVTRPDGYVERFNQNGLLASISNPDYPEQQINIVYTNSNYPVIDYITDGVGRKYDFDYDITTGLLQEIQCCDANGAPIFAGSTNEELDVEYSYTNGYLTSVTYPDGESVKYTYDINGNMTSIENIDGYRIAYTYGTNGKITQVTEQALDETEYVNGNYITYERLNTSQVKLTDSNGNYEVYQFAANGKLLYTNDSRGNYSVSETGTGANDNYFTSSYGYKSHSQNLLENPSFEKDEAKWNGASSAFTTTDSNKYYGSVSLKAERTSNATTYKKQTVNVLSGGEYTFSAYVKSDDTNSGKLFLKISSINSSNVQTKTKSIPIELTGNEWQRYTVTLDAPSNTKKIAVEIGFANSKGTFYIDATQLEQSSSASDFNFIDGGNFKLEPSENDYYTTTDVEINNKTSKAIVISKDVSANQSISQTITIDGKKNDVFNIGGWMKASFVKSSTNNALLNETFAEQGTTPTLNFTNDRYAQLEVSYDYVVVNENNVEETITEKFAIPFAEYIDEWQFASDDFALKGDTDSVTIIIRYINNSQDGMFADIELTKDEDAVVFDDTETNEGTNDDSTEETDECPCENCEEFDCTCSCESEDVCNCTPCKRRSYTTATDSFGNITSTNSFDGVKSITSLTTYTANGNYIASETDEDGNTVTYDYNLLNSLLNAVTDARGNETEYTYDASGALTQVSSGDSSVSYSYTNDRLTAITHNGFSYNLSYDIWGQLEQISVGSQPIVTYYYGENEYRDRVISSVYHNSSSNNKITIYQYDAFDNIIEIDVGVNIDEYEPKYLFTYDSFGTLTEISATDSRIVRYVDDRVYIFDFNENCIYSSYTNSDGNLVETIGGTTFTSKTYDSNYDVQSGSTVEKSDVTISNGKVVGTVAEQDWFGRYTESVIKTESANDTNTENTFAAIKTEYTYPEYNGNKTSNRVDKYVNKVYNSTNTDGNYKSFTGYSYDYDANSNIIAEYKVYASGAETLRYGYVYDELNQLVRVNDAVAQETYTYTYDDAGNILAKTIYPYTTGELSYPDRTINYTYDSVWKDKLISYGSTNITYDNIGNPLTIGNKNFTWEERQLQTYEKGATAISFEYDESGLRHRKSVTENGVLTQQYDYVWSNGKLISQTHTTYSNGEISKSNSAKFIYNEWGELLGITLNNSNTFLYIKNLQGDITGIANENGDTIVTYTYDSWGKLSYIYDSEANDEEARILLKVSPFTYRGYCYDYDMEMYYLQSRYYNPGIGRFINTDDTQIAIASQGEILGANLFSYCENNPINYTDPTGYASKTVSQASKDVLMSFLKNYLLKGKTITSTESMMSNKYGLCASDVKYKKSKNNTNKLKVTWGGKNAWLSTANNYFDENYLVLSNYYCSQINSEMTKLGISVYDNFNFANVQVMSVALTYMLISAEVQKSTIKKKVKAVYGDSNSRRNQNCYMFQVTKESSVNGWYAFNPTNKKGWKV